MKKILTDRYHKHYHPKHRHGLKHLIADIAGISLIALLAAFIVFIFVGYSRGFLGRIVDLKGESQPSPLVSGEDASFKFKYENQSEQLIQRASLFLDLPSGFKLKGANPEFLDKSNSFFLGDLASKSSGEVEINGQVIGQVGGKFRPTATLNFEPTQFSLFTTNRIVIHPAFEIADSALRLDFETPEDASAGEVFEFKLKYENTSPVNSLDPVSIKPSWGSDFTLISSEPGLNAGAWLIGKIDPGSSGEILIKGSFAATGGTQGKLSAAAYIEQGDKSFLQVQKEKAVTLFYPKLAVEIVPDQPTASLGQEIKYSVRFTNNEDFDLSEVTLSAEMDPNFFEVSRARSASGKRVGRFIHWDSQGVPALASLKKGETDELSFTAVLKSSLPVNLSRRNLAVVAIQAKYGSQASNRLYQVSTQSSVKIVSDLGVRVVARYFSEDGEQLGRGPLPPRVGRETKYWIFVTAVNSVSDIAGAEVRLRLPSNVRWTGRLTLPAGDALEMEKSTGDILWRLGDLSVSGGNVTVGLEISLTPAVSQLGQEASLVLSSKIKGTDTFTERLIERSGNGATTRIPGKEGEGLSEVIL